jgi:PhnB protein
VCTVQFRYAAQSNGNSSSRSCNFNLTERGEENVQRQTTPEGFHSVTPYLFIKGAANAIEFYKNVFGATEVMRMPGPNGQIMHAELRIGDSIVMLSDENPQIGALSPQSIGGTASGLNVYIANVDAVTQKAVDGGAKLVRPVKDQFYGDRSGTLIDPFGHIVVGGDPC